MACVTCATLDNEQKPKPGILLCIGCQQQFCSKHMAQHRQYLTDFLENTVVNERNALQEELKTNAEQQWASSVRIQLETINKWEVETIEVIKQAATNARKCLQDLALEEGAKVHNQFTTLSNELNTLRENEDCLENDIDGLINKFQLLKNGLEHFPIELNMDKVSEKLISVKSIVQPPSFISPLNCFVDRLLTYGKPNTCVDISAIKPGRMYPIGDMSTTFYSKSTFLGLNISNMSWENLIPANDAIELYWSDYLQVFLMLRLPCGREYATALYQLSRNPRSFEHIRETTPGCYSAFTTLTCYKQYVVIVRQDRIEKWTAENTEWYTTKQPTTTWFSPISCQRDDEIKCIRMNDQYYAFILKNALKQQDPSTHQFFFELRNHGMSRLHRIKADYEDISHEMRLFSLPDASGWFFFFRGKDKEYCYVLDNDAKRYDQNVILSSNVTDIAVYNNLIFLRKKEECGNIDVLEIYRWTK